jgi:aminoglycoside phosphotransferase family enzyme/predicted kinase
VDYSTVERRLAACRSEVAVNAELAPGLYRGVRPLLADGSLGPFGEDPGAVDYAVEMRRFDEDATLAARLAAGRLTPSDVDAAASVIAAFHARAGRCEGGGAVAWRTQVERDLGDLSEMPVAEHVPAWAAFADGLVRRLGGELDARAADGLHRDGHGDLRADHVVLEDPVLVVDRLEFDPALRAADVAGDLAFLAMDLEARGGRWAAERLVRAYVAAGGTACTARLFAGLAWQRALVRIKTALLSDDAGTAQALCALADRLAWRSRAPRVLLVGGPPASGKSTLARAVAEQADLPVLRSDVVRKQLLGLDPQTRAGVAGYTAAMNARTYRELGRLAAERAATAAGVVVDATLRTREAREAVLGEIDDPEPLAMVVCEAPLGVLARRAEQRERAAADVSDAGPGIAVELARGFEMPGDLGDERVCRLRTDRPVADILDDLARWLDAHLAPG